MPPAATTRSMSVLRGTIANKPKGDSMTQANSDHLDLWAYESAACEPTAWERWIAAVEAILGHGADGDGAADGYSLDEFYDHWKQGWSVAAAAAAAIRAVATVGDHRPR